MPKSITITRTEGNPGAVYYPLSLNTSASNNPPTPPPNHLLIKLSAAALNHRDLFIRQQLYPGISFDCPLLADGVGTVVSAGEGGAGAEWVGKRVVLSPGKGWESSPDGPEEGDYQIFGGTKNDGNVGMLQEYVILPTSLVEEAPTHLSNAEAAALPLTGLTAWRALISKGGDRNSRDGARVLITGIGGGVALMALRFAVARGAEVWVTSGDEGKIRRAVEEMGAKGGVSYKEEKWERKLLGMLPEGEGRRRREFDLIVDGAGGDVVEKGARLLKPGGVISIYGMTVSPKMPWLMQATLKNIDLKGSTMGSRKEFKEMVEFVRQKEVRPVVSRVVQGLDNIEGIDGLFEDMKNGSQFGKLVVEFGGDGNGSKL
ncbi:hypothetical protein FQN54_004091 [Arachnomyces sp. PD_36]|nr:hypothetical protein FQN54_004091 [Arachnomyces sp. PD_36]